MSPKFEAPRGMSDILPAAQPLRRRVVGTMEEVCRVYGYRRIDTPGVEDTGLIVRTSGEGSDVVQKETYTFDDRGGRSLTLRPEGTAPIARAYVEHGLHREAQPQKLAGALDSHLQRRYASACDPSHFLVLESFDVTQQERFPLRGRQSGQCCLDLFPPYNRVHIGGRAAIVR